jgi:RNA polymerase sigma-70 factor (ECF subfamily)
MSDADAELMGRYCDGDASAFRDLYALAAPPLRSYLLRMTGNRALADDLLQQTFLKLHKARSTYVRGARPMPWLYAIAHRTCLDALRARQRARVRVPGDPEAVPEVAAEITGHREGEAPETGPDPAEMQRALDALQQLPSKQREAVVLLKLDGRSVAEAAAIAGTTPGALKVRAHRGYARLRELLGKPSSDR